MPIPHPAGFARVRVGVADVLVEDSRRERMLADGLGRMPLTLSAARPRGGGRGSTFEVTLGGEDLVMRLYRRGGFMRFLLRDRSFDPYRSFREVAALVAAAERAVPAVVPVAAVAVPAGLGLYRHYLFTKAIPSPQDLLEALSDPRRSLAERRSVISAAASTVRAAFEKGVDHVDLHPRNILVLDGTPQRCVLVDLDRARIEGGSLPPAVRMGALARFVRFLERHAGSGGDAMTRTDVLRFLRGVEGAQWKPMAREVLGRVQRWRWMHRLGAARAQDTERVSLPPLPPGGSLGPECALTPPVSFVISPGDGAEALALVRRIIETAELAGLQGFELIASPRSEAALAELRALSARVPSLRFLPQVARESSVAWGAALRGARAERTVCVMPGALDAQFLTEALQRVDSGSDVVIGARGAGGRRDERSLSMRLRDAAVRPVARVAGRSPLHDPMSTFVARRDGRFEAALRSVRSARFALPELLGRLVEAGARVHSVPVEVTNLPN